MDRFRSTAVAIAILLGLNSCGIMARSQAEQSKDSTAKAINPNASNVIAGEVEAKKLVLLMDTDGNGKVSRDEFMKFMAAEFDRLDVNKDGELDVKELSKSQLSTAHRGGTHR